MDKHLSLSSRIVLAPRRAGLRDGQANTVDVLVRVQAPDAPAAGLSQRPPQALALVIDRSGSMAGHPLAEAQRCATFVVSRLRPCDAVAVIQFDNRVQRLWPAIPLGDGDAVRGAISRIEEGGSTDLHGGWLEGAQALSAAPEGALRRVILLSDGEANAGLTDSAEISMQCAAWAAQGVTTSTYGLGSRFNEELMVALARSGGGNQYYGDTADDLMEPFQQELDLLANLALSQVRLRVEVPDGVVVEMLNELPLGDAGWQLTDLAWGAEAWVVLRLTVPIESLPPAGQLSTLLRVTVTGQNLQGEPVQLERTGLALPVTSAPVFDALTDDELVTRRLVELAAAQALTRVRDAASAGEWATVDSLLADASRQFAGNDWVIAVLEAMRSIAERRDRQHTMKETMYSSQKLRNRLAAKDEDSGSAFFESRMVPSYLWRKTEQGKADQPSADDAAS